MRLSDFQSQLRHFSWQDSLSEAPFSPKTGAPRSFATRQNSWSRSLQHFRLYAKLLPSNRRLDAVANLRVLYRGLNSPHFAPDHLTCSCAHDIESAFSILWRQEALPSVSDSDIFQESPVLKKRCVHCPKYYIRYLLCQAPPRIYPDALFPGHRSNFPQKRRVWCRK